MALTRVGGAVKSDRIFDTVADMVASKTVKVGDIVETAGYTTVNDGGGAKYEIVAAATGTDDGGSFIDLDSLQAKAIFDGVVTPERFGAMGDGVTDDYTSLNNMKEFANSQLEMVLDGSKTYAIGTEWDLKHSTNTSVGPKLKGNGAKIKALSAMTNVVSVSGATKLHTNISDLFIDADNKATTGFYASFVVEMDSRISGIRVVNATGDGQLYDGCQVVEISNLVSQSCGGTGIVAESCNGARFESIRCILNVDGVRIRKGTTGFSSGCSINSIDSEINTGYGIVIEDSTSPVKIQGWFEANDKDGVLIESTARNVHIYDTNIIGEEGAGAYRAIRIEDGALGCTIENNLFNKTAGSDDYSQVEDENTSNVDVNQIRNNYFGSSFKLATTSRTGYYEDGIVRQVSTVDVVGKGGQLSGGTSFSIAASGSITLTFQPYGTFNVVGSGDRGVYAITLKMVGTLAGFDEAVYKEFLIFASTGNSADHDQSSTEVQSIGDSTRKGSITIGTPAVSGTNAIQVTISNADDSSYDGYLNWEHMMTTEGTLTLSVT